MPLSAAIFKMERIGEPERAAMFDLHSRYYCNVRYDTFIRDMSEKDWIIILRSNDACIAGFSTVQVLSAPIDGRPHAFLFSGDTVVERAYWQSSTLSGSFCHVMMRLIEQRPDAARYWLLISKGFRTYRYLPVFFNEFHPVFHTPMPKEYKVLLDYICGQKFGDRYNAQSGIIESRGQGDFLKPDPAAAEQKRNSDPHIDFFLKKNPGFFRGDELACLAKIATDNFNRRLSRILSHTKVVWHE